MAPIPRPNLDALFRALARSSFRSRFTLQGKDRQYYESRGLALILEHARDFVAKRLAPALPARDGKQTPWYGHPVFVAQHATATCCRGCLEKWHSIPQGRALTDEEQAYVIEVIREWLERQPERDEC